MKFTAVAAGAASAMIGLLASSLVLAQPPAPDAEGLFKARCGLCHAVGGAGPAPDQLAEMPRKNIVLAMTSGSMQAMAIGMTPVEIEAVAAWLTPSQAPAAPAAAAESAPPAVAPAAPAPVQ